MSATVCTGKRTLGNTRKDLVAGPSSIEEEKEYNL